MRRLTSFADEARAQLFCDALYAEGIETTLRPSDDPREFNVWVHDERRMDDARAAFEKFESNQTLDKFEELAKQGRVQRTSDVEQLLTIQRRTESLRNAVEKDAYPQIGRATLALIVICVGFAFLTRLQEENHAVNLFTFSNEHNLETSGWNAILNGQVWRLFTPAFIHFGVLHIVLNLWWIKDLGTAIEFVDRTRNFVGLVLTTIVVSHIVQVVFVGFTPFGGMSGVAYGLFGYVWIRGRLDPTWRLQMPRSVVSMMLAWLVIGFFMQQLSMGAIAIANGVHVGGLLAGAVWGFFMSGYLRRRLNR